MTEAEWLGAKFADPLLEFIEPTVSDRKLHYYAIACARRITPLLTHPSSLDGIDVLEQFAEGKCSAEHLEKLKWHIEGAAYCVESGYAPWLDVLTQLTESMWLEIIEYPTEIIGDPRSIITYAAYYIDGIVSRVPRERQRPIPTHYGLFRPVWLVYEIFGNPFRRVKFKSKWRSETVLSLAHQMYDSKNFSAMPILADALEDSDCDSEDLLNHCRGPGPHVRGCWAVDAILTKK